MLLVLTLSAIVSAFIWGRLVDRFGPEADAVLGALDVGRGPGDRRVGASRRARSSSPGILIGAGFAGLHVSDRVLMYRLSPPDRLGEFYGLYGLVGKGSQVLGNLFWGIVLFLTFDTLGKAAYQIGI